MTYGERLAALAAVWERWAEVGAALTDDGWSTPSRCAGWDVAALFAHVGMFPQAVLGSPQADTGDPVTAAFIEAATGRSAETPLPVLR